MNCPVCGGQMNHHADKLDPKTGPARVIAQIHTCRKCGHVECVNDDFGRTLNGTDASFRRG